MEARVGSVWRTITVAEAYVTGAWRTITSAEAYVGGAWQQIASFVQPLTLFAGNVSGAATSNPETTAPSTATPTGGLAPFTYSWELVSSTGLTDIAINSPTSSNTTFTASAGVVGHTGTATFRCTVTDSLGSTASDEMTATFTHETGTGGGA